MERFVCFFSSVQCNASGYYISYDLAFGGQLIHYFGIDFIDPLDCSYLRFRTVVER